MPRKNVNARKRVRGEGGPVGPGWLSKDDQDFEMGVNVGRAVVLSAANQDVGDSDRTIEIEQAPSWQPDDRRQWRPHDHHYATGQYAVDESDFKPAAPLPEGAKVPEPMAEFMASDGQRLTGWAALRAMQDAGEL